MSRALIFVHLDVTIQEFDCHLTANSAHNGVFWRTYVETRKAAYPWRVNGLGRERTIAETTLIQLEMWCRETGCGFESRALRSERDTACKRVGSNGLRDARAR